MSPLEIGLDLCTYVTDGDISYLHLRGLYIFECFYGGSLELSPPTPKDEDNIMAALKQSGRLFSIKRPFSELEDLVLLSRDGVRLTLPSTFRWGPRLRCLHLTRTAFPALLQLLYSSTNLVDLQLHEVFESWQFPPEALTVALSAMAQLRSLSLHLLSTANHRVLLPQSWGNAVLPFLTHLNFRGISEYLECLVARIDAPRLGDIELAFLNKNISFPKLREFIDRIEMHKSHRRARILSSEHAISISFIQPGTPACLKLQLFCKPSNEQLLFMTRVCARLCAASLFKVEDLRISTTRSSGQGDGDYRGWRDLLNSFTGTKQLHVAGNLSTHIVRALKLPDSRRETLLPALQKLYIPQPWPRHAPLREAVVSFMTSRRLSGHPMAVEYERPCHINVLRGIGPLSQEVTIQMLSDDILLDIFRHCLDPTPQIWPTLACICQRWRQIIFASPLGLNLRLCCTHGTPVLKNLDYWPAFPIILKYGGFPNLDPPTPEDDNNIIAALKQFGRVSSIRLTVTSSLLAKLSAVSEPFSELEELVLLSRDNMQLTLPSTFRWGPHLRTLHSTRIALHTLPQLLSPSHDLVDIQLHEIPSAGYFSPEAFANALSGMTNLRTLSLHFLSLPSRRNFLSLPPLSGERVILPALTLLKYRRTSKYLDSLVARIDAPGLGDIDITFFSQPTMDTPQLGRFIQRIELQTSLSRTYVQTSAHAISITFSSSSISTRLRLQISCKQLDWQLSSMAQVCDQFSPFLFRMNDLRISSTQSSSEQDSEQWLQVIRRFGGATDFRVADKLTTAILYALGLVDGRHTNVLPSLRHLIIEDPMAMDEPSWGAVLSFVTLRSRSGHPIQVNVPINRCYICHASFREQKEFNRHLVDMHAYRILCAYCRDFECKTGYYDLFREHLDNEHPHELYSTTRFLLDSRSPLPPHQLDSLVTQHSLLRAPDIATMVTAPHSQ
ncbi:hypothetical protein EDB83DRAFT_2658119 [Lactarius deliciosus]|nr:hypothetical protein EDB83DRAFT_2658119 [Lactarius deliciosus]